MNAGLHLMLLTRKRSPVSFAFTLIFAFLLPIIVILSMSTLFKGQTDPFAVPLGKCKADPCYHLAFSPSNSPYFNIFLQNFQSFYKLKTVNYKTFATQSDLQNYLENDGKTHVVVGLDIATDKKVTIFSRDKTANVGLTDQQIMNKNVPGVYKILQQTLNQNDFEFHCTAVDASAQSTKLALMTTQISMFSMVYLVQGISIVAILAKMKDKRSYEYLVVSGLNRVKFFSGILLYVFIEITASSFIVGIIFAGFNMLHAGAATNLFVPLFFIPSALSFCFAFALFSFSLLQSMNTITLFFTFVGFFPGYLILILSILIQKREVVKIVNLVGQILLPGMSPATALSCVSAAAQYSLMNDVKLSFGEYLTFKKGDSYPLWFNILLSVFSFAIYTWFGLYLDQCMKSQTHPTTHKFFQRKRIVDELNNRKLIVRNLQVHFNKKKNCKVISTVRALDNVSITFKNPQSLVGLVAQNGAGKTTLFKAILGTQRPTQGSILLNDKSPQEYSHEYYRQMSVVFQENIIFSKFTVMDQLSFMANVMGEKGNFDSVLELMGLENFKNHRVDKLSGGQQRRLQIATSMMRTAPTMRIYDEPACGVDIESRKFLWKYLKTKQDCLTLLTTHIMEEAEELCDEVIILKEGKLVAHGSLLFIKQNLSSGYEIISDAPNPKNILQANEINVKNLKFVQKDKKEVVQVPFKMQNEVPGILKCFKNENVQNQIICPNLTEVFLKVCDSWEGGEIVE
ncbi:ABC_transporter family protein [Hexamita inflata]|uniref:ABC transporter family protein n=1 Tax=Hexamita inflata TaxID=28002 RepID=A0AA86UWP3_9EUKA|nr:ABC transporter family protein [Hexamita inflata]